MRLKEARQIFKAFSDDTRLRIVNLLNAQDLAVKEIFQILNRNQSNLQASDQAQADRHSRRQEKRHECLLLLDALKRQIS